MLLIHSTDLMSDETKKVILYYIVLLLFCSDFRSDMHKY